MKVDLTHDDLTVLMRSLLRSIDSTPERESAGHKAAFDKINDAHTKTFKPGIVKRVGRAIGHAIGE